MVARVRRRGEACGRSVQSRRTGLARGGRAFPPQPVHRSGHHRPAGAVRLPLAQLIAARRRRSRARSTPRSAAARRSSRRRRRRPRHWRRALVGSEAWRRRVFVAMRYWHPFSDGAAKRGGGMEARRIVLLPLYPQYSTTTTASSMRTGARGARPGLNAPHVARLLLSWRRRLRCARGRTSSARPCTRAQAGCPTIGCCCRRMACRNDHRKGRSLSVAGGADRRGHCGKRWGWTGSIGGLLPEPGRSAALDRTGDGRGDPASGRRGKGRGRRADRVCVEHSETLVELDIEYAELARESGVPDYLRVPTVGVRPRLHRRTGRARDARRLAGRDVTCGDGRICPDGICALRLREDRR